MRSDESFDFTIDMLTKASKLNFSSKPNNLRNLATLNDKDSNKNALVPVRKLSKKAGRRLAKDEDKEDCEDQIEDRIKAIKNDVKTKYKEFSPRRFERTYPITKKMKAGTKEDKSNYNDNYKNKTDFKDAWRKDWHSSLIHYLECNDFDVYNPKDMRNGKKLSKAAREKKLKCKDKVTIDDTIKKYIKDKIPYPAFAYRTVVDPEESEDEKENNNSKRNEKLVECLENDVLKAFETLSEGITMKNNKCKYEKKKKEKKRNVRRLNALNLRKAIAEFALPLSPHKDDVVIYSKIKILKRNSARKLAYRSSMPQEQSMSELLEQCKDRNRMLSLLRYEEDKTSARKLGKKKNISKKKNASKKSRKLDDSDDEGSETSAEEKEDRDNKKDDDSYEAGNGRRLKSVKKDKRILKKVKVLSKNKKAEESRKLTKLSQTNVKSLKQDDDDDDEDGRQLSVEDQKLFQEEEEENRALLNMKDDESDDDVDEKDIDRALNNSDDDDDDKEKDDEDDDRVRARRLNKDTKEDDDDEDEEDRRRLDLLKQSDQEESKENLARSLDDEEDDEDRQRYRKLTKETEDDDDEDRARRLKKVHPKQKDDSDGNDEEDDRRRLDEDDDKEAADKKDTQDGDKKALEDDTKDRRRLNEADDKAEAGAESSDEKKPEKVNEEDDEGQGRVRRLKSDEQYMTDFLVPKNNIRRNRVLTSIDENVNVADESRLLKKGEESLLYFEEFEPEFGAINLRAKVMENGYDLASLNEEEPSPIDMCRVEIDRKINDEKVSRRLKEMLQEYKYGENLVNAANLLKSIIALTVGLFVIQ